MQKSASIHPRTSLPKFGGDLIRLFIGLLRPAERVPFTVLPPTYNLRKGIYRVLFAVGDYFARQGTASFFPEVTIAFKIEAPTEHYHVPLLLSPHGYTTYRGS